ncbi:hypothetical protein ACFE04_008729 [Oxalis oulophora]
MKISDANETYRSVNGTIKAILLLTIYITKMKNPSLKIPLHYFDFASPQILSERIGDNEMLTDVIGTLDALGEIEEKCIKGKDTKILKLEILTKAKKHGRTIPKRILQNSDKAIGYWLIAQPKPNCPAIRCKNKLSSYHKSTDTHDL